MTHVRYYTKLGCVTAGKQIELLKMAGHSVEVLDLLAHDWTAEELCSYFGTLPVADWFNVKSPRIKEGEIDPGAFDREAALTLLLADHLLIHRPLMESAGTRCCGFDPLAVHSWIGLGDTVFQQSKDDDFTSCSQPATRQQCP